MTSSTDITFIICAGIILSLLSGYFFPIKDSNGQQNRPLSVLLAVFIFPIYLILLALQYPYVDRDNKPNVLISLLVLLIFWPAIFFITDIDNGIKVKPVDNLEGDFV